MNYLSAILIALGAGLSGWAWWMGRGPYDADGDMWLIAPMLLGLAMIATGIVVAVATATYHAFR